MGLKISNKIQSGEYSTDGGLDYILYNRFCLAELERQERSVSLERRQQAKPELELVQQ